MFTFLTRVSQASRLRVGLVTAGVSLSVLTAVGLSGNRAAQAQDGEMETKISAPLVVNWKFSTSYFPNSLAAPAVDATTVYFGQGNRFYAVDKQSGGLKWQYPADKSTLTTIITAPPMVSGDGVYFSAADGVYALNAATGKQKWLHFKIDSGVYTNIVAYNDLLLFGGSNGRLYALNAKTGKAQGAPWASKGAAGIEVGDFITDLAVADDLLYFITNDQVLHAFSLVNGSRRWAVRMTGANIRISTPVVSGESLYIAAGNRLLNIRRNNGQVRWQINLPGDAAAMPTVDPDGNCYLATSNRNIFAINSQGRGIWRTGAMVDNEILAAPVYSEKLVFVVTTLGGVSAFDAATGGLRWNYTIQPTSSNPATIPTINNIAAKPIVANGALYILSDDGAVTAFRGDLPDTLAPIVTNLNPTQGDYLNGRPPFTVSAKVTDDGSGLKMDTLRLKIDDRTIAARPTGRENQFKPGFYYSPENQTVTYTMQTSTEAGQSGLADGHHTATLSVSDWKGNVTIKAWTFYVDDTIPRRAPRPANTPGGTGRPGAGDKGGGNGAGGG